MKIEIELSTAVGQMGEFREANRNDIIAFKKYIEALLINGEDQDYIYSHGGLGDGNYVTKDGFIGGDYKVNDIKGPFFVIFKIVQMWYLITYII